jgi:endonuclease/exonuclease/phosphatase family metal-dependent hydrolase
MRRLAVAIIGLLCASASCAFCQKTIRVTTWNLQWFPSGSSNRAAPEVEQRHIDSAANQLRQLNPDVVLLQEVRDWSTCERLAKAINPSDYHVLVCSAFRENFGGALGQQQVAILAKHWAQAAWSERWARRGKLDAPRGFAFAAIRYGDQEVGFYSLHLKSNLVRTNRDLESELNIAKRELATEQLVSHINAIERYLLASVQRFVVGGDLNTDRDQAMFVSERTLATMAAAGFTDTFFSLPLTERVTHPGTGRYPDATFDYIFVKNLKTLRPAMIIQSQVSDHRPVTCELEVSGATVLSRADGN